LKNIKLLIKELKSLLLSHFFYQGDEFFEYSWFVQYFYQLYQIHTSRHGSAGRKYVGSLVIGGTNCHVPWKFYGTQVRCRLLER